MAPLILLVLWTLTKSLPAVSGLCVLPASLEAPKAGGRSTADDGNSHLMLGWAGLQTLTAALGALLASVFHFRSGGAGGSADL